MSLCAKSILGARSGAKTFSGWGSKVKTSAGRLSFFESATAPAVDLKELHAKIGQLALENDFLAGALTKAGMLSAKR